MSGVVGSRLNNRGSGVVGSLGTDGQVFTSAGAGKSAVYEAAAAGGKLLQVVHSNQASNSGSTARTVISQAITLASASNKCLVKVTFDIQRNSGATTQYGAFRITGGSLGATTSGFLISGTPLYTAVVGLVIGHGGHVLDASPGGTSVTYGLYFDGGADFNFAYSQITVMEID